MTLSTLLNRPCSIVRRNADDDDPGVERDGFGNVIPDEGNVEQTVCELQQRRRTERGDEGEVSESDWLLFFLPGTEIDTNDLVIVDDRRYEIVGEPWPTRNPRTQAAGQVEVTAKRVAGAEDGS